MIEDASLHLRPEIETELKIQAERLRRAERDDYLDVRVRDVPSRPAILLQPSALVVQALRWFRREGGSAALVVDSTDRLLGIVTLADLAFEGFESPGQPVANVMSAAEVVHEDDPLVDVLRWMLVRDFSQVPVINEARRVRGLIRVEDVLREITAPHARQIATRPADPTRGYAPRYGG